LTNRGSELDRPDFPDGEQQEMTEYGGDEPGTEQNCAIPHRNSPESGIPQHLNQRLVPRYGGLVRKPNEHSASRCNDQAVRTLPESLHSIFLIIAQARTFPLGFDNLPGRAAGLRAAGRWAPARAAPDASASAGTTTLVRIFHGTGLPARSMDSAEKIRPSPEQRMVCGSSG